MDYGLHMTIIANSILKKWITSTKNMRFGESGMKNCACISGKHKGTICNLSGQHYHVVLAKRPLCAQYYTKHTNISSCIFQITSLMMLLCGVVTQHPTS